jgi:3-hydroxyisobutyrate dehydrogenase-like beta-hydroxyacid dehydrogenase
LSGLGREAYTTYGPAWICEEIIMTVTVAVIAMGEMGSGVAARLVERGARVLTNLEGRSAASAERARSAGVEIAPDDDALVSGADFILSIVPPARAGELAMRLLPAIRKATPRPLYVDCNAIAPQTLAGIARPFLDEGLPFADAGIIGGPPMPEGYTPVIYASGEAAGYLARLNNYGLDIRAFAKGIGDASALKMAYAGTTKGAHAVMISMMLGAQRAGVGEAFVAEMKSSQAGRLEAAVRQMPMVLRKAYRWDGEMEEIAKFLDPEAGGSEIFRGAAELYRDLARDFEAGPEAERMALLDRYAAPPAAQTPAKAAE